jgi:hypothetical protein
MLHALCLSAFLATQTLDTATTVQLLAQPLRYHEANPLLPASIGGILAVKLSVSGAVVATAWKIRHQHPRWAVTLLVIGTVSSGYASAHNVRLLR